MRRLNNILRKIGVPFNAVNTLVGLAMSVAYVYIPMPSTGGLIFGIVLSISSSACVGINYYFTTKNANTERMRRIDLERGVEIAYRNTRGSNVFISALVPLILLSSVSNYFGMNTGITLLANALSIPIGSLSASIIAMGYAVFFALGELNNTWLQTYNIWEELKQPVVSIPQRNFVQDDEEAPLLVNEVRIKPRLITTTSQIPGTMFHQDKLITAPQHTITHRRANSM